MGAAYARALLRPPAADGGDDLRTLLRELRRAAGAMTREERRRRTQPREPQPLEPEKPPGPPPPEGEAEPRTVYAAVAGLPDELRDAVVAVDIVGLSPGEAARVLRARERTVIARLARARRELGRALAAGGGP